MKKAIASELEKMKKMNRHDLVWYIAEYYKFHIVGLILIFVLLYVTVSTVWRMSFTTVLHCICINNRSAQTTNFTPLEKDYAAWMDFGKKDVIYAEDLFVSYGEDNTEYGIAGMEKIAALTMSRELDVILCDTDGLEYFSHMGAFLDLEEELPSDLASACSGRLLSAAGTDGRQHVYGIDLSGTPFAADSGLGQVPPVLGIVANTQRRENAVGLVRFIFRTDRQAQVPPGF